jgi:orotate phosphoribosyltransferase
MTRSELAQRIYDVSNLKGEFRLRSGRMSNEYFDKYLFEGQPAILLAIAEAMAQIVPADTDALAGLEMGGIPVVTMLSQITGIPALFVRKKPKEHGTCKLAEGGEIRGRRLVVVEDVVTSGGQIIESVHELRALGATVTDVLCVIDRESGGRENLAAKGLTLHPLFLMSELKRAASQAPETPLHAEAER